MKVEGNVRAAARAGLVAAAAASLAACATVRPAPEGLGVGGTMRPYQVNGVWYRPAYQPHYDKIGLASWYGPQSRYHTTADGERFDVGAVTGAHTTLPLPCIVEVTDLDNGRRIRVRVNDRGPFVGGRIIDLSPAAARELGFYGHGMARVRVRYVGAAPLAQPGDQVRTLEAAPAPAPAPGLEVAATALSEDSLAAVGLPPQPAPVAPVPPLVQTPVVQGAVIAPGVAPGVAAPGPAQVWRVQAATYADRANADRAVARLSERGDARIEPVARGGATLWRVVVWCAAGERPDTLRDEVVAAGFPGARLVGPS